MPLGGYPWELQDVRPSGTAERSARSSSQIALPIVIAIFSLQALLVPTVVHCSLSLLLKCIAL